MSPKVELRLQIAAVTLANELNYTRAARRLGISQPGLSRQITDLEEALGYHLFLRSKRHVKLTEAGEIFVAEARGAIEHTDRAMNLSRAAHLGAGRSLSIGRSPYTDPLLVDGLFAVYLPLYPQLHIKLESGFALDLIKCVVNAGLDLAIVTEAPESRGITRSVIAHWRLHVGMRSDHPLSGFSEISLSQLNGECWAVFVERAHPIIYARLMNMASSHSIQNRELQHIMSMQDAVPLIANHGCVAFISEGTAHQFHSSEIVFRPLIDPEFAFSVHLVLRADNSTRLVNEFARAYIRLFERKPPTAVLRHSPDKGSAAGA